ncbi:hypothetical protein [Streptomyces sp. NPDC088748]|uniref:hypothetical protein n=1 Tax=Streptomyces sp. NPDC088748 TaxID=3365887 RepID=UPI00380DF0BA
MRSSTRRPGRPSLLTPERIESIVKATAVGVATSLAAEGAGVSRATVARWMARGRDAAQAREDGEPTNPSDDAYVDLYQQVNSARAQMAARALARVLQAGAGSLVLEERVRTYNDPVTGLDVEERQTRYLRPDWRAAAWWLAHVFPEHYGPNAQSWEQVLDAYDAEQAALEPSASPDDPHLAEFAERLAATLAAQDSELPPPLPAASP